MNESRLNSAGDPIEFWYNLKTGLVEVGKQSHSTDLVGPFETREAAEAAPKLLVERAAKWKEDESKED